MDPTVVILGGIVVGGGSALIGKYLGGNGKVTEEHCKEKRLSCQTLLIEKIDNLADKVDALNR